MEGCYVEMHQQTVNQEKNANQSTNDAVLHSISRTGNMFSKLQMIKENYASTECQIGKQGQQACRR